MGRFELLGGVAFPLFFFLNPFVYIRMLGFTAAPVLHVSNVDGRRRKHPGWAYTFFPRELFLFCFYLFGFEESL